MTPKGTTPSQPTPPPSPPPAAAPLPPPLPQQPTQPPPMDLPNESAEDGNYQVPENIWDTAQM